MIVATRPASSLPNVRAVATSWRLIARRPRLSDCINLNTVLLSPVTVSKFAKSPLNDVYLSCTIRSSLYAFPCSLSPRIAPVAQARDLHPSVGIRARTSATALLAPRSGIRVFREMMAQISRRRLERARALESIGISAAAMCYRTESLRVLIPAFAFECLLLAVRVSARRREPLPRVTYPYPRNATRSTPAKLTLSAWSRPHRHAPPLR
ncbi:hypothetical protein C8Q80DRAFT_178285 [Daedaleopsis nitida]|nr:hypothetical protein C8Q80DRAFT_178285 [Daedaleopsis nitida]